MDKRPDSRIDYRGEFDPTLDLTDFDHELLACYGRELMLANHIHDRSALSQVAVVFGMDAQTAVACDEWMGSSPIYNARNRTLHRIKGDDVGAVFKCFQLDIGAPHNYLKFHYELVSPDEGYFWTTSCGPYNHVRRLTAADPAMETQICHHMEDPTFDATVMAVNPRMRCRPVFRPPHGEVPQGGPCRWRVAIEQDIGLVEDNPNLARVQQSLAADFVFQRGGRDGGDGIKDYSGAFKADFVLEDLAHESLAMQCKEFALDVLLLNRACYTSIAERFGEEALQTLQLEQWQALAPLVVHRLRKTFSIENEDMHAILKCLQLNPFLPPEYLALGFKLLDANTGRIWVKDCAALREPIPRGLANQVTHSPDKPGFDAIATAVNPGATVSRIDAATIEGAILAWQIDISPNAEATRPSDYAGLVATPDLLDLDNTVYPYDYDQ